MRGLKWLAAGLALLWMGVATALPVAAGQPPAPGAAFAVTTLNDAGPGSLRQAIEDANALAAADMRIQFDEGLGGGRVLLGSELPVVGAGVTIAGPAAGVEIAMDAGVAGGWRHFRVGNDASPVFQVVLQNLTLTGPGDAAAPGVENGGILCGGAGNTGRGDYDISPHFEGSLALRGCVVQGCVDETSASFLQAGGGGVSTLSAASALVLQGCTLQDNRALGLGGGVLAVGSLRADNSTLQNCRSRMHGGGMMCVGAAELYGCTLESNEAAETGGGALVESGTLVNCTLTGNVAGENGGGLKARSAQLQHCTLSGNRMLAAGQGGAGVDVSATLAMDGGVVSGNYDVLGDLCEVSVGSTPDIYSGTGAVEDRYGVRNLIGVPGAGRFVRPTLAALQTVMAARQDALGSPVGAAADNGGGTRTILITAGGPACNALPAGLAPYPYPAADQRGTARPQGAAYDLGAVELRLITRIVLSTPGLTLAVGGQQTLSAGIEPQTTDGPRTLAWASSAPAVATVDQNGRVRAVGPGTATITAAAQDGSGVTAGVTVTVIQGSSSQNGGGGGGETSGSGAGSRPASSGRPASSASASGGGGASSYGTSSPGAGSADSGEHGVVVVDVQQDGGDGGVAWWAVVLGGVLLLGLGLLLLIVFRRRRREEDEDDEEERQ